MKRTVKNALCILLILLSVVLVFTACDPQNEAPQPNDGGGEHTHTAGEWTVAQEASCTQEGTKQKKCSECDEVLESESIAAIGHSWNDGEVVEGTNIKVFTCTECEETKTEEIPINYTVTADEWAKALNLLAYENYVHTYTSSMSGVASGGSIWKNGNNIRLFVTQGEYTIIQFWVTENGEYRMHEKLESGVMSSYWNFQFEYHNIFSYTDFEYDEETKSYISDEIIYGESGLGGDLKFSTLSFQFENGKIVKLSYTQVLDMGDMGTIEAISTETITYGNAPEIVLPELE